MGLWKEYVDYVGLSPDTPHEEWAFGGDPDRLSSLVLKGIKTGTASLYSAYEKEGVPLPSEGDYSVILDSFGKETCVIQCDRVTVVPFSSVDHYHAYREGEDDRSLEMWRRVHREFFAETARECQTEEEEDPLVVLEKFSVVYPPYLVPDYTLVQPEGVDEERILEYRNAFLGRMEELHGTAGLGREENIGTWLEESIQHHHPDYVSNEETVQATQLFLEDRRTGAFVGAIHIRHALNSNLRFSGGHIGYSIRPEERRKGLASLMLQLTLSYARALKMEKVLITCDGDNEASRRTILSQGGVLENVVYDEEDKTNYERYWITL